MDVLCESMMPRDLTPVEVAAMWIYRIEYATGRLGAIEFWKQLDDAKKKNVRIFLRELKRAIAKGRGDE